jgi:hypothetical protein
VSQAKQVIVNLVLKKKEAGERVLWWLNEWPMPPADMLQFGKRVEEYIRARKELKEAETWAKRFEEQV